MNTIKRKIGPGSLTSAIGDKSSIDDSTRTVTLTWTTGFKGLRNAWDGSFYEELSLDAKHVDMSRLNAGAPLLASHDSSSLNAVIGVVERAWLEGTEGRAKVRFSADADADKIYQKVKEGVLRNVSVGYQVRKYEDVTKKGETTPTYRATNWQPHEISIVPIGFDPSAQIRAKENLTEVEITTSEKKEYDNMSVDQKRLLELEVKELVRTAKLDESLAAEIMATDGITVDQARKLVLEKMASAQPAPASTSVRVEVGSDNHNSRRRAFEDAILHRLDPKLFPVTSEARSLTGQSLIQQVQTVVPRLIGESEFSYSKRALSTSDLPALLSNVGNKALLKQYELAQKTYAAWTRSETLPDYKVGYRVRTSDMPNLLERQENGEFKLGKVTEDSTQVQLKDFGVMLEFTHRMIVNDDLRALSSLTSAQGLAAARADNKLAYAALTTNNQMPDGVALYHASHGNLGSASAINSTSVGAAIKAMRSQKTVGGLDYLNLYPKFMIVGLDKEAEARAFLASVNPAQTSQVNIYQNAMDLIVEPSIGGNAWYLVADPSQIETVSLFRLEGEEQPNLQTRVKFENDALQLKVSYAVNAFPMSHKGLYYNPGA